MGLFDIITASDPFKVKFGERTLADGEVSLLKETEDRDIPPFDEVITIVDHTIIDVLRDTATDKEVVRRWLLLMKRNRLLRKLRQHHGLKFGVVHGKVGRDLKDIEAYCPEAKEKYDTAVKGLENVSFPLLESLEGHEIPLHEALAASCARGIAKGKKDASLSVIVYEFTVVEDTSQPSSSAPTNEASVVEPSVVINVTPLSSAALEPLTITDYQIFDLNLVGGKPQNDNEMFHTSILKNMEGPRPLHLMGPTQRCQGSRNDLLYMTPPIITYYIDLILMALALFASAGKVPFVRYSCNEVIKEDLSVNIVHGFEVSSTTRILVAGGSSLVLSTMKSARIWLFMDVLNL
nr:transposase (putative), gypsy type [Tanacetum cinerariifolium]